MRRGIGVIAAVFLASAGSPATAEEAVFDLSVRGLLAGTLSFTGKADPAGYAVSGQLESAGVVRMIREVRYTGAVEGRIADGRLVPQRYVEKADTGKRKSEAVMDYRGGVPQVKVYKPPRDPEALPVDPATQGGTLDPLSAMFAVLGDVETDQACDRTLKIFDGKRSSRIVLAEPVPGEDGVVCAGEYRRVAGFSAEDMAEKSRFAFRMFLVPHGDGKLRVTEVRMDSLYGKAVLKRR